MQHNSVATAMSMEAGHSFLHFLRPTSERGPLPAPPPSYHPPISHPSHCHCPLCCHLLHFLTLPPHPHMPPPHTPPPTRITAAPTLPTHFPPTTYPCHHLPRDRGSLWTCVLSPASALSWKGHAAALTAPPRLPTSLPAVEHGHRTWQNPSRSSQHASH